MLRAFYGSQNLVETRTTNLPGFLLETTGGGRLAMARLLRNFETDRAKVVDPPWDAARRHAGAKANAIVMLDLPRVGLAWFKCGILSEVGAANAAPQGRAMRDNLDKAAPAFLKSLAASYSVAAVTTESHAARCRIYLPRQQVDGLLRFSEFMISTFEAAATPVTKPAPKATVDDP
jgi:hypothetical protein